MGSGRAAFGTYDCLYVGLAERERCKVVTADQRVLALFPLTAVALDSLP
jgi:predicted nucleic acid-binding protein